MAQRNKVWCRPDFDGNHIVLDQLLSKNAQWLHESGLENITLDADSTVKSVCGNQEGAAKGFNTTKNFLEVHNVPMHQDVVY